MRIRLLIAIGVALALAACGRQEPSGLAPAKAPAPAAAPAVKSTAPTVPGKTAADAGKPLTMTHLNEDGSETVEETPGDTSAQNRLLAAVASTVAAATPSASAAAASGDPVAGRRELHPRGSGAADQRCRRTSRGTGVFLVRLPALLRARTHGASMAQIQARLHHLHPRAGRNGTKAIDRWRGFFTRSRPWVN